MKIGSIDLDRDVFLIAEIGNNHEGDVSLAMEMIQHAARSGAHAVKFQTIDPEKLVSASDTNRIAQLEGFRLTTAEFEQLAEIAGEEGLLFMSTPFHLDAVPLLDPWVPAFKIASGDNDFYPLIDAVLDTGKPMIVSSGMTVLSEIERTRDHIRSGWKRRGIEQDLALLHCVVSYPTAPEDAHLNVIRTLASLGETVGYSDHTLGIEAAVLAVALGARIVEKHFTIDRNHSQFRDHQLSADPSEFSEMARRIRDAQVLLGSSEKGLSDAEVKARDLVRRGIVAGRDLKAGHRLAFGDLAWVRPALGLRPGEESRIVGKVLCQDIHSGDPIFPEHLDHEGEG